VEIFSLNHSRSLWPFKAFRKLKIFLEIIT
jgi:hypothetical protein